MIKLFVFSLLAIVLALLVTLYLGFPADPGYLLIAFGNTTFETSLFALLVAAGAIYLVYRVLMLILHWINPWQLVRYGRHYQKHRKAKARSNTVEGLLYFARGNWQFSYNLLLKSVGEDDASVVNYLTAAYAAFKLGEKENWVQCLERAEVEYPLARSTVNTLKAQLLFKSNQLEQCLAVLQEMRKSSLNDTSLLQLLKDVYIKLEDWDQLRELLPTLEQNGVVHKDELERMQMRVFMEALYSVIRQQDEQQESISQLLRLWKKAPNSYKQDEKIVKHYFGLLIDLGETVEAGKVIEYAVAKKWSKDLVLCYGAQNFGSNDVGSKDTGAKFPVAKFPGVKFPSAVAKISKDSGTNSSRLNMAETWLKTHPSDASLLLTLGRLSMRNELWGKAKEYYQSSIQAAPSAEAYGELGRLLKNLGETEASEACLKSYGDLVEAELVDLPLPPKQTQTS